MIRKNNLTIRRRLLNSIYNKIKTLFLSGIDGPPIYRRITLILIDLLILNTSVNLCFWIQFNNLSSYIFKDYIWLVYIIPLLGIPFYSLTGVYKSLTRYVVGSSTIYNLSIKNAILISLTILIGNILDYKSPPSSTLLLLWLLITINIGLIRFSLRDLLLKIQNSKKKQITKVAIYGAGSAGAQLAASLRIAGSHEIITFLDDSPYLYKRTLYGIPIKSSKAIESIKNKIDQVLLAIPSLKSNDLRKIVSNIQAHDLAILKVPSIEEIISGKTNINKLTPISIEDLLGRDVVSTDPIIIGSEIKDRVICVSGAGGSIGSELCRQIIKLEACNLILIESHEPSLYSIHQELLNYNSNSTKIFPILGSATDFSLVESIFKWKKVDIVFHAAAYKHVPLVENNPLQGLFNNVFSTKAICDASFNEQVKKVILISTDKAVRPCNIMGASKRLSELIFQAYANKIEDKEKNSSNPIYSMVRFGNVLGSSGSVVPLFKKQIESGGPITVTHKDVIRYFMTIKEATSLVLQSSVLGKGGEVFLLDMGEPVKIIELAKQMIKLSGLTVKDSNNKDGDIEIVTKGLRPGEKLYEELLIDAKSESTTHPLIFKAKELYIPYDILTQKLNELKDALRSQDKDKSFKLLSDLVPEWRNNNKD